MTRGVKFSQNGGDIICGWSLIFFSLGPNALKTHFFGFVYKMLFMFIEFNFFSQLSYSQVQYGQTLVLNETEEEGIKCLCMYL